MEFNVPIAAATAKVIWPAERTSRTSQAGRKRNAKRQQYTLVACDECKRRKIKCNGGTPCNRCERQDVICVYEQRRLPEVSTLQRQKSQPQGEASQATPRHSADRHHLWPLSRTRAVSLLEGFREEVILLHPFIDLQELHSLVDRLYGLANPQQNVAAASQDSIWDNPNDVRNVDFLKVVLACALASKGYAEQEPSRTFVAEVDERSFLRQRGMYVDVKDLAIATVFSIYQYYCDNINLAWRAIGIATKLCLELGLHRRGYYAISNSNTKQSQWAKKLFWCVYVLDRKFSFMANLPFSIHDEDLDFSLLQSDVSSPNLKRQVAYGRIGGKILPAVPRFGEETEDIDDNTRTRYGRSIDDWNETAIAETIPNRATTSAASIIEQRNTYHLRVHFQVLGNQMRLSLYKSSLYSPNKIVRLQKFACLAIQHVTETIRLLDQLRDRFSDLYEEHAIDYTSFIASALGSLCLAIRNAPQQFSRVVSDYCIGLKLLKSSFVPSIRSETLSKTIQTWEHAISLSMPDIFEERLPSYVNFASLQNTEANQENEQQADTIDYNNNLGVFPKHNAFAVLAPVPMMPLTPSSHVYFGFQEGMGTFVDEESYEQSVVRELPINEFIMDDTWNPALEQGMDAEWTMNKNLNLDDCFSIF